MFAKKEYKKYGYERGAKLAIFSSEICSVLYTLILLFLTRVVDRIINCEKATFTPLVFTTTGGMGPECHKLNKRLAELIAIKKKESYSHVIGHIRTKLRFALLRSVLVPSEASEVRRVYMTITWKYR